MEVSDLTDLVMQAKGVWVCESVPYKYFHLENWLHLDHPEKDNWLICGNNLVISSWWISYDPNLTLYLDCV
jgi:hypothetical protein